MNRIIKFRAWEPYNSRMVYEPYRFEPTPAFVLENPETEDWEKMPFIHYETWLDLEDGISRPCHIMQFTGLTDKNGKEIWEGDVVKETKKCWVDLEDEENGFREKTRVSVVVFRAHGFWIQDEDFGWEGENLWDWDLVEVIGNIYENPELIKP